MYTSDQDPLYIYHAGDSQKSDFTLLQNDIITFLDSSSDEAILVNIQEENSDAAAATFWDRFDQLANHDYWSFVEQMPTLGDARKKMILIRPCRRNLTSPTKDVIKGWDWPGHGLEWNGFAVSSVSWSPLFQTQNYWHGLGGSADGPGGMGDGPGGSGVVDGSFKGTTVEKWIDEASQYENAGKLYLNFLSRADTAIGDAAADINAQISGYIKQTFPGVKPRRFGVLPIDFSGNTGDGPGCLEDEIISRNAFAATTTFSYGSPEARRRLSRWR